MMKCIESRKVGKEEAYLGVVEREGEKVYRAGISSYGDATHCSRSSGYKTLEEAQEAYEFYKELVYNQ